MTPRRIFAFGAVVYRNGDGRKRLDGTITGLMEDIARRNTRGTLALAPGRCRRNMPSQGSRPRWDNHNDAQRSDPKTSNAPARAAGRSRSSEAGILASRCAVGDRGGRRPRVGAGPCRLDARWGDEGGGPHPAAQRRPGCGRLACPDRRIDRAVAGWLVAGVRGTRHERGSDVVCPPPGSAHCGAARRHGGRQRSVFLTDGQWVGFFADSKLRRSRHGRCGGETADARTRAACGGPDAQHRVHAGQPAAVVVSSVAVHNRDDARRWRDTLGFLRSANAHRRLYTAQGVDLGADPQ